MPLLLPILFLALEFLIRNAAGPFWMWLHIDPSYFYLLNGLMLASLEAPADVFHPGTPIHVLVALAIKLSHPLTSTADLQRLVLGEPERYLTLASNLLIFLNAAALYYLGRAAVLAFGGGLFALMAQASPFLAMVILKQAYHVKPEPLLLLCATLMGALLIEAARRDEKPGRRRTMAFGLVAGLGIAGKLLFIPLAAAPIFLLATPRKMALYAAAAIFFFLLFLSPALSNWHIAVDYFQKMFLGSGAYGGGEATIVEWSTYPANIAKVFAGKPLFDLFFFASLVAILWRIVVKAQRTPLWRALEGVALAQALAVLMVAKHPIAYYMLAAMSLSGVQACLLAALAQQRIGKPKKFAWAFAVFLALIAASRVNPLIKDVGELNEWRSKSMGVDMSAYRECAIVYYDFATSPTYALFMGDMMTRWRWASQLAELHPASNQVFMNFFTGHPKRWGEKVDLAQELAARPCFVMRGGWKDAMASHLSNLAPNAKIAHECAVGKETLFLSGIEAGCAGLP